MFNRLYDCYKADFDMEMRMQTANVTYAEAFEQSQKAEEWF